MPSINFGPYLQEGSKSSIGTRGVENRTGYFFPWIYFTGIVAMIDDLHFRVIYLEVISRPEGRDNDHIVTADVPLVNVGLVGEIDRRLYRRDFPGFAVDRDSISPPIVFPR